MILNSTLLLFVLVTPLSISEETNELEDSVEKIYSHLVTREMKRE